MARYMATHDLSKAHRLAGEATQRVRHCWLHAAVGNETPVEAMGAITRLEEAARLMRARYLGG